MGKAPHSKHPTAINNPFKMNIFLAQLLRSFDFKAYSYINIKQKSKKARIFSTLIFMSVTRIMKCVALGKELAFRVTYIFMIIIIK